MIARELAALLNSTVGPAAGSPPGRLGATFGPSALSFDAFLKQALQSTRNPMPPPEAAHRPSAAAKENEESERPEPKESVQESDHPSPANFADPAAMALPPDLLPVTPTVIATPQPGMINAETPVATAAPTPATPEAVPVNITPTLADQPVQTDRVPTDVAIPGTEASSPLTTGPDQQLTDSLPTGKPEVTTTTLPGTSRPENGPAAPATKATPTTDAPAAPRDDRPVAVSTAAPPSEPVRTAPAPKAREETTAPASANADRFRPVNDQKGEHEDRDRGRVMVEPLRPEAETKPPTTPGQSGLSHTPQANQEPPPAVASPSGQPVTPHQANDWLQQVLRSSVVVQSSLLTAVANQGGIPVKEGPGESATFPSGSVNGVAVGSASPLGRSAAVANSLSAYAPDFHEQLANQIGRIRIVTRPGESGQARFTLDPKELGELNVRMEVDRESRVNLVITTVSEAARDLIVKQISQLQESLSQHELSFGQVQVEVSTNGRGQSGQPRPFRAPPAERSGSAEPVASTTTAPSRGSTGRQPGGGLSILA